MNSFIIKNNLKPGDRLVSPKSFLGIVMHHVIYYGKNEVGIDFIIENAPGFGVRFNTVDAFLNEYGSVFRIERFTGNEFARKNAIERAVSQSGKLYDLQNYNCETFCNYVQYGIVKSKQSENALAIGGVLLSMVFLNALFSE